MNWDYEKARHNRTDFNGGGIRNRIVFCSGVSPVGNQLHRELMKKYVVALSIIPYSLVFGVVFFLGVLIANKNWTGFLNGWEKLILKHFNL